MNENGLSRFIVDYIESRKQLKLEAFDKEAKKKLAKLNSSEDIVLVQQEFAKQRKELEKCYTVGNWLDDAASRASQIRLATHVLKFTHTDARGSSILAVQSKSNAIGDIQYLSTATLHKPAIDAAGNAAALDLAKLLLTEYQEGDSLLANMSRGDYSVLAELAENEQQLELWISGFQQVLSDKQLSSHRLAKQLYFPVSHDEYHLLSPLFSSSLAHSMRQRIIEARFGELSKEINKAKKEEYWCAETKIIYPNTAIQSFGSTKPQITSYLNNVRGGRVWLLSCSAPNWLSIIKPPMEYRSIFDRRSEFVSLARETIGKMRQYLFVVQDIENNRKIRKLRQEFVDQIIDILFNYVAGIQNLFELKGWSANDDCELKRAQQLWLDPYRCQLDKEFRFEREGGDWKKEIAADFSYWLNQSLKHERLEMELSERREWASVFKKRLREFEDELPEVMP
ncbi:type I-F CRISPR-associated protein Csy1 [Photorhabdus temperata]|uniref:type I-F CRISPR-associated protein Csy1 n=1 Tax=Photorhabdus temperata TaxID=574560 RepID=UPI0021D4D323|nr:type I-F CRISPR-associated protein Csy1 [Photorhabdus temperata]MCT8346993.1 type I-F CRISPR-associated protein Csy1 [Photorhabdus temperata]